MSCESTGFCVPTHTAIAFFAGAVCKDIVLQEPAKQKVCSGAWDNFYVNGEPEMRTERIKPIC